MHHCNKKETIFAFETFYKFGDPTGIKIHHCAAFNIINCTQVLSWYYLSAICNRSCAYVRNMVRSDNARLAFCRWSFCRNPDHRKLKCSPDRTGSPPIAVHPSWDRARSHSPQECPSYICNLFRRQIFFAWHKNFMLHWKLYFLRQQ